MAIQISLWCKFTILKVPFSILCRDNDVLMIWFGLGKERTWLWFRKDHVYSFKQQSSSDEKGWKVFNLCSVIFKFFCVCVWELFLATTHVTDWSHHNFWSHSFCIVRVFCSLLWDSVLQFEALSQISWVWCFHRSLLHQ